MSEKKSISREIIVGTFVQLISSLISTFLIIGSIYFMGKYALVHFEEKIISETKKELTTQKEDMKKYIELKEKVLSDSIKDKEEAVLRKLEDVKLYFSNKKDIAKKYMHVYKGEKGEQIYNYKDINVTVSEGKVSKIRAMFGFKKKDINETKE